jgi:hypothetical protein
MCLTALRPGLPMMSPMNNTFMDAIIGIYYSVASSQYSV